MTWDGYLQGARQRFIEFGGFGELAPEQLPEAAAAWAEGVLIREEPGLTTLVALVPFVGGGALRAVRDCLLEMAEAVRCREKTEVMALLLVVTTEPVRPEQLAAWQELKVHRGAVRLVPWAVDLVRHRLFVHQGPPFGTDPDLVDLAAPEPPFDDPAAPDPTPAPEGPSPEGGAALHRGAHRPPRPRMPLTPVTLGLVGLLVAVWVAMTLAGGSLDATQTSDELLHAWGAATRPEMFRTGQYWRLLSATFIHIGAVHLLMNGLSLWWVGRAVEILYGRWRMLFIFLVAGVAGSAASALFGPPHVLSAGASGAIFGLLGAILWFRVASPLGHRIAWRPLALVLALNLLVGIALAGMVDNWNHGGGLLGGILAAAMVGIPELPGLPRPRLYLGRPVHALLALVTAASALALVLGLVPLPGPGYHLARALDAWEAGDLPEADARLTRLVDRYPSDPSLRLWLAGVYIDEGRCAQARRELEAFRRILPRSPAGEYMDSLMTRRCGR